MVSISLNILSIFYLFFTGCQLSFKRIIDIQLLHSVGEFFDGVEKFRSSFDLLSFRYQFDMMQSVDEFFDLLTSISFDRLPTHVHY
jgi:hypothetical protein